MYTRTTHTHYHDTRTSTHTHTHTTHRHAQTDCTHTHLALNLSRSLTHSLTHSLIHSLTHALLPTQAALDDNKELDRAKAVNKALMVRIVSSWAPIQRENEIMNARARLTLSLSVLVSSVLRTPHDGCVCSLRVQTKEDVLERALQKAEGTMPATNSLRTGPPSPTDNASKELLDRLHSEGYISDTAFQRAAAHEPTALQKAGWVC